MASLVLMRLDDPALERDAIVDAITRVWSGVLTPRDGTAGSLGLKTERRWGRARSARARRRLPRDERRLRAARAVSIASAAGPSTSAPTRISRSGTRASRHPAVAQHAPLRAQPQHQPAVPATMKLSGIPNKES